MLPFFLMVGAAMFLWNILLRYLEVAVLAPDSSAAKALAFIH